MSFVATARRLRLFPVAHCSPRWPAALIAVACVLSASASAAQTIVECLLMKPNKLSRIVLGAALLFCGSVAGAQTPTITPTANATTLVNTILGPGVTLVPGSELLTGGRTVPDLSAGLFENGGLTPTGIGIASGILLTTGRAADAIAPNDTSGMTTVLGLPGDAQLTGLAGYDTSDATVLSFSFTTTAQSDFSFRFAFASEVYPEFVD